MFIVYFEGPIWNWNSESLLFISFQLAISIFYRLVSCRSEIITWNFCHYHVNCSLLTGFHWSCDMKNPRQTVGILAFQWQIFMNSDVELLECSMWPSAMVQTVLVITIVLSLTEAFSPFCCYKDAYCYDHTRAWLHWWFALRIFGFKSFTHNALLKGDNEICWRITVGKINLMPFLIPFKMISCDRIATSGCLKIEKYWFFNYWEVVCENFDTDFQYKQTSSSLLKFAAYF